GRSAVQAGRAAAQRPAGDGRIRSESNRRAGKDRALASSATGARRGNQAGGRGRGEAPFRLGLRKAPTTARASSARRGIGICLEATRTCRPSRWKARATRCAPYVKRSLAVLRRRAQPTPALALYSSKQEQDDDDHEHEAQPSRGVIAPAGAIGPGGE